MSDRPASRPVADAPERAAASISDAWRQWRSGVDLREYDTRWDRLAAEGHAVHGEADFVASLDPGSVLDAGCGAGRVGAELARRGIEVVGVDNDPDLLRLATAKPAPVRWVLDDLAAVRLGRRFDVVVLAGNVLPYVRPDDRADVVVNLADHLAAGGGLVIGGQTVPGCGPAEIDHWCSTAGLRLAETWSGWEREAADDGAYRVSVHRVG
ncbi:MAG: class I SAM-dependent methyltransferase [Actinomycetota bacterium]